MAWEAYSLFLDYLTLISKAQKISCMQWAIVKKTIVDFHHPSNLKLIEGYKFLPGIKIYLNNCVIAKDKNLFERKSHMMTLKNGKANNCEK